MRITLLLMILMAPGLAQGQSGEELTAEAALQQSMAAHEQSVAPFLRQHCLDCHGEETQEGELNLLELDPNMQGNSAARWAMVYGKLTSGEMPPEDRPRPKEAEIEAIGTWIKAEMKRTGKHLAKREQYAKGNSVPHELLFDEKHAARFDAAVRIRRRSPEIYQAFADDVGKRANGLSQPFTPPPGTTFSDMGTPKLDEPTTQALIRNALRIVESQLAHKVENGKLKREFSGVDEFIRLLEEKDPATTEEIEKAIGKQFDRVLNREPSDEEMIRFKALLEKNIADAGRATGVKYTLAAVFLMPDAIYRWELGSGTPDEQGRVRLASHEIADGLAFALTDEPAEGWLRDAAKKGQLDTDQGVEEAVRQMLAEEKLKKPRILRFFRQYFGYATAGEVFKDKKEFGDHEPNTLIDDTDKLILLILERDKQVLRELLTTNESFVAERIADDLMEKRAKARKEFEEKKKKDPEKYKDKEPRLPGRSVYESYSLKDFPDKQPTRLPADQRAGILTQPSWLVAWSKSDENDAIHRGKWVRERLLGGVVPDIPITVDAQLPNAPEQTLRQRMAVTQEQYCWQCHTYMNRVGLPFEMYDHYGRYRETIPVVDLEATEKNLNQKGEHQGEVLTEVEVDASGGFEHVPDPKLSGDVTDAVEMLHHLAKSEYVEQVFVRHAFRYWTGRNETPGDGASLRAVHRAYRAHDGSMNELVVALLTSESFLYRVPSTE